MAQIQIPILKMPIKSQIAIFPQVRKHELRSLQHRTELALRQCHCQRYSTDCPSVSLSVLLDRLSVSVTVSATRQTVRQCHCQRYSTDCLKYVCDCHSCGSSSRSRRASTFVYHCCSWLKPVNSTGETTKHRKGPTCNNQEMIRLSNLTAQIESQKNNE